MAYNKIGFLAAGSGGNPTGIGDYVRRLDAAGIPAIVMCNDGLVGIGDALALIEAGSRVPHVMAYRVVKNAAETYAVPDYGREPAIAARTHWDKIKAFFPSRFVQHRDKIWLLPINEVDKNRADWLGRFGVELAKIANGEGYKVALFGWSTGEPEPEHWETPGMLDYLRYCAQHPDQAAVCLHEYSLDANNIKNAGGHLVGRFTQLFTVCDRHHIRRPQVLIGEWGWGATDAPDVDNAVRDITEIAALYAQYPEVLGAGIWYLGPGFGGIARRIQPLIQPVTELTLSRTFTGPTPTPAPKPTPEPKPVPKPEPTPTPSPDPAGGAQQYIVVSEAGAYIRNEAGEIVGALPQDTKFLGALDASGGRYELRGTVSALPSIVRPAVAIPEPGPRPVPVPDPIPEPAEPVLAVDVSEHQGVVDWDRMWAQGIRVAFVRLGDGYVKLSGAHYEDTRWRDNWAGAGRVGMKRGAYYFFRNQGDPNSQANHFMSLWRQAQWELPPAGDFEDPQAGPGPAALGVKIRQFLLDIEETAGQIPWIYTRKTWWDPRVGFVEWAGRHPLWVAMYPSPNNGTPPAAGIGPAIPTGWGRYSMWQWCGGPPGGAPGIEYGAQSQALDLNWYYPGESVAPPLPALDFEYSIWPTTDMRVNQYFGENPANYARFGLPGHDGVDLEAPADTPIFAPAGGTVTESANSPAGFGQYVVIDHGNGYRTSLAHLNQQGKVSAGSVVVAGDVVGTSGNTGNSSGYHLHVALRKKGAQLPGWPAGLIDPWPYLQPIQGAKKPGALFGLHASADGNLAAGELQAFQTARIELVKVLSSMGADDVSALAGALPSAQFIIRAFLSFGDRHVSPAQFCDWTLPDVKRALERLAGRRVWVELHNEPNLYSEGMGRSWPDGIGFGNWLTEVLTTYRQELPGVTMLFPGLSPGGTVGGVRLDSKAFIEQARGAVTRCDGLAVHTYWATNYPMRLAMDVIDDAISRFHTLPIFVTEASNNKGGVTPAQKGAEYITFWWDLGLRPAVRGVTYFVASATHRDFQEEVWVNKGSSNGIAEVVRNR